MRIPESIRRDIFDWIMLEGIAWYGRLTDCDFLSRLYELDTLPSDDFREKTFAGEIWRHRVINPEDWEEDWVFKDSRLGLVDGPDRMLLNFLCEMLHPVVRSVGEDVEQIRCGINLILKPTGYEIYPERTIAGKSIYAFRDRSVDISNQINVLKLQFNGSEAEYILNQITRMERAVEHRDYDLAIGTAKELIETVCKTILENYQVEIGRTLDFSNLVRTTLEKLNLAPKNIPDEAKASNSIKGILGSMANIASGLAYLRNHYGSGHGRSATRKGLNSRHARLAIGAASTLAIFLVETYNEQQSVTV
ncbi:abortive infection family protein [Poriferisphaera sp. WC338]|uniref:abortive infection family protein n=1 Tax=Poriferisphaera sp. WC338 TaxID=3425129 RepID=UPI003D816711